jgi:hypothetical protein
MSELTDLYLIKKLAEIERLPERGFELTPYRVGKLVSAGKFVEWNPLTDKALCFDLMVKHKIHSVSERPKGYYAETWSEEQSTNIGAFDKSPQKSICLAIIAKHNKE